MAETSPTAIERALTLDILRGRYAAGSRLPTVRELAELHAVSAATIQRAVARLETRGLVVARQGSGLRVNDPAAAGDLSLLPSWIEATLDQPVRASAFLEELLELRRVLAARLLVRHRDAIVARLPVLAELAARVAHEKGVAALCEADVAFVRALLLATGNQVVLGVFNTLARVVEEVPLVAKAMYADPGANAAAMMRVLEVLADAPSDAAERIEAAMAEIDARTIARFAAALRSRRRRAS